MVIETSASADHRAALLSFNSCLTFAVIVFDLGSLQNSTYKPNQIIIAEIHDPRVRLKKKDYTNFQSPAFDL